MAYVNTGYQGWKILQQIYADDQSLTGMIMPNLAQISAQAIVPSSATITFNDHTDVTPTGGANGDIWYNGKSDNLYKNISGIWTLLTDRVTNDAYYAPVYNVGYCPLP